MRTIMGKKGKVLTVMTLYVCPECLIKFKALADEMDLSFPRLVEKLIDNFYKFREKDSK